jgi:hypothetical protein
MSTATKIEPFAVTLLIRSKGGATVDDISRETGIPAERIAMRLRAAQRYVSQCLPLWHHGCPEVSYEL